MMEYANVYIKQISGVTQDFKKDGAVAIVDYMIRQQGVFPANHIQCEKGKDIQRSV